MKPELTVSTGLSKEKQNFETLELYHCLVGNQSKTIMKNVLFGTLLCTCLNLIQNRMFKIIQMLVFIDNTYIFW